MRVGIYAANFEVGGVQRVMVAVAEDLLRRGHEVEIATPDARGPFSRYIPSSVDVIDLGARTRIASVVSLSRWIARTRSEVILSAMASANCSVLAARMIARRSIPVVISDHTSIASHVAQGGVAQRLLLYGMRALYPLANGSIAVSQGVADDLRRMVGDCIPHTTVIYNPIVDDRLLLSSRAACPHRWLEMGEVPVVLGVGRLIEAKNFELLIRAFAQTRNVTPCRLVILGEGPLREHLEALVVELGLNADVLMPGSVDNPMAWMSRAGVFVLSSRREGFGNVIVEAMASGAPVVATDCRHGPREIIATVGAGRLVADNDRDALTGAIKDALRGKVLVADRAALAPFGFDRAGDAYEAALLAAMAR